MLQEVGKLQLESSINYVVPGNQKIAFRVVPGKRRVASKVDQIRLLFPFYIHKCHFHEGNISEKAL